jgi:hypothetical protein
LQCCCCKRVSEQGPGGWIDGWMHRLMDRSIDTNNRTIVDKRLTRYPQQDCTIATRGFVSLLHEWEVLLVLVHPGQFQQ